jgi:hypothetical protein
MQQTNDGEISMPCDSRTLKGQSLSERKTEVRAAISRLSALLAAKQVKPVIGPQGAIFFQGWSETDRGRVSDVCAYRLLLATGSALARAEIAKAEQLAGRAVDKQVIGQGVHSHDGKNWHHGH